MYRWILLAHAIGAAVLFGAHVYLESLMAGARRDDTAVYMRTMLRAGTTANRIMAPAGVITLIFGVWLVIDTAYDFEDFFVLVGIVAIGAAFAISIFLMKPRFDEIEAIVAENGIEDETAVSRMQGFTGLIHAMSLIVAIAFVAMILKPGI